MMGRVRQAALVFVAFALCVPAALAAKGDPQKKITRLGQARAVKAALQRSDFPAGWKQQPRQPQQKDESDPRCSYYNPDQSDLVEIGDYDSRDFEYPDGSSISSSTGVFRSVQMARTAYSRVAQPELAKCLAELFRKGAGVRKTTIFSATKLAFPHFGDRSDAYRIVAAVKTPAVRVRAYLDLFLVNRGAVDVAIIAVAINRAPTPELEQKLVGAVASRAQ